MKLDRNINPDGRGKYALILLRKVRINLDHCQDCGAPAARHPKDVHRHHEFVEPTTITIPREAVDFGEGKQDFFVMRLKDQFCPSALRGYYEGIREYCADHPMSDVDRQGMVEYAKEILGLLEQSQDMVHKLPD
jgi:hypothetical protein